MNVILHHRPGLSIREVFEKLWEFVPNLLNETSEETNSSVAQKPESTTS